MLQEGETTHEQETGSIMLECIRILQTEKTVSWRSNQTNVFVFLSSGDGRRNVSDDKRKDPSHPRPPHIFNTRFFFFFSFLLISEHARITWRLLFFYSAIRTCLVWQYLTTVLRQCSTHERSRSSKCNHHPLKLSKKKSLFLFLHYLYQIFKKFGTRNEWEIQAKNSFLSSL